MIRSPVLVALLALLAVAAPPARADLASMVADLAVAAGPNRSSHPEAFVRVGSRVVFFAGGTSQGGSLPWATDGTSAGTGRLPGANLLAAGAGTVGGAFLWFAVSVDDPAPGYSLWRSDGDPAGTARLAGGVYAPREGSPIPWALAADRLYFFRRPGDLELWESDGTASGTRRVAALPQVEDEVFAVAAHRGRLYFLTAEVYTRPGGDPGTRNWSLWRTGRKSGRTRLLHRAPDHVGAVALYPTAERLLFFPGEGVWATDGTARGTAPLPGPPGEPDFEVAWIGGTSGGKLYFGGREPPRTDALWASDGTVAGTRRLARGLTLGGPVRFPDVLSLGDRTFFVAADDAHGAELWSTRGTPATTARVVDLCPGPCSAFADPHGPSLAVAGGRVFLLADDGVHGTGLWVTDGTAAGTRRVLDLDSGGPGVSARLRAEGGEVFFYRRDATGGVALWASDGTPEGTRRLTAFAGADPFSPYGGFLPAPSVAALGRWIVTLGYDRRGGFEPWALERRGRAGHPLGDLATAGDPRSSAPFDAVALGDALLFATGSFEERTAWSTRGSAETTVPLGEVLEWANGPRIGVAGGVGYLNRGDLWRTDGTPEGTVRLTDFDAAAPGSRVSTAIVDLGGRAVFGVTAGDSQTTELWASDGTPGGTRRAGPPSSPLPSFPRWIFYPTVVGDELFFWANDGETGWEVWGADAALTDLRCLTDRDPGYSDPWGESAFTRIGGHVYFLVPNVTGGVSLWRSDGTPEGTEQVPPPASGWWRALFGARGSVLLLISDSGGSHLRLWSGDGSGTDWVEIHDFGPRSWFGEVVPGDEEALIVVAEEGRGEGLRLYRTDGTAAGTAAILDLAALGLGEAYGLTPVGGRLFFAAGSVGGIEPWVSDGTQEGTRRLQEIAPGAAGSHPERFTRAGSRLYFPADDGLHGRELWSLPLDGLEAPCRPSTTALCLGDGRFRAELFLHDRSGRRGDGRAVPWSSTSGAFWLYDFGNPEAAVKMVDGGAINERSWLFFGPLGDAYFALTVTDLETGASRRYPAEPGPLPAFVHLAAFPSAGTAPADEAEPIAEPESLRLSAPSATIAEAAAGACRPSSSRLCLNGGRFAVELAWADPSGAERAARAFAHGEGAGYFAFHGARDVQAALKILDGRPVNGRFWLFATSLTHLGYALTVTETETGTAHRYVKPAGEVSSVIDLSTLR